MLLAVRWSYIHSWAGAAWRQSREACLQEPNMEETTVRVYAGRQPACNTHVKDSPRHHMISGDIISNGVKSLNSRGPGGETHMLSPGPATRWSGVTNLTPDHPLWPQTLQLLIQIPGRIPTYSVIFFCRLFKIHFSSSESFKSMAASLPLEAKTSWQLSDVKGSNF